MNKDNALRGQLLDLLQKIYPEGIEHKTIVSIFFQYHRAEGISASLEYLADKGYVSKKELPHPYIKHEIIQWYKLTPTGIDLLDGNIPADPGIIIQRG